MEREKRPLYVVPNWDRDFENAKSRITENCTFVCIPNNFDGKKIRRLSRLPQAQQLHGAFLEILQVASKCPWRGVLLDGDGPIGAMDLADKTLFPQEGFELAFSELTKPMIGLLERYEIEKIDGRWILPEAVRHWAVHKSKRRLPVAERDNAWEPVADADIARHPGPPRGYPAAPAATKDNGAPPSATSRHEVPRREEKAREVPPAVPQGGPESFDLIEFPEAKQILNEIFGREKRKWSFEEDQLLSELCPVHRTDLELARQWFSLPLDHQVFTGPQRTLRKQELTTYLRDFAGENDKIRRFRPVFQAVLNGSEKKEPAGWREYFRREYGEDCRLPERYDELPADQRAEFERARENELVPEAAVS
jgi:hypothetical protein